MAGALLFTASSSFAAMECVTTKCYEIPYNSSAKLFKRVLHLTCTFDDTPGTAVDTLDTDAMTCLDGTQVKMIGAVAGDTAPDAASVAIADSRGKDFMTAAGNGLNLIHASEYQEEYCEGPNNDDYQLAIGAFPWTITVTDQATNNAIVNFYVEGVE